MDVIYVRNCNRNYRNIRIKNAVNSMIPVAITVARIPKKETDKTVLPYFTKFNYVAVGFNFSTVSYFIHPVMFPDVIVVDLKIP